MGMHKISFYRDRKQWNNALCRHSIYKAEEADEDNEAVNYISR